MSNRGQIASALGLPAGLGASPADLASAIKNTTAPDTSTAGDTHIQLIKGVIQAVSGSAVQLGYSRTDSCGTTGPSPGVPGSAAVADTSCVSGDVGLLVRGTGIPHQAVIKSVVPGSHFVMNVAATATGSPSLTLLRHPAVTCTLRGGSNPVGGMRFYAGYTPQVGDTVDILVNGSSHTVLGQLATITSPSGGLVPVGAMLPFPATYSNPLWLHCNGGTFSAATFPVLAALLGGTTLPTMTNTSPVVAWYIRAG